MCRDQPSEAVSLNKANDPSLRFWFLFLQSLLTLRGICRTFCMMALFLRLLLALSMSFIASGWINGNWSRNLLCS